MNPMTKNWSSAHDVGTLRRSSAADILIELGMKTSRSSERLEELAISAP